MSKMSTTLIAAALALASSGALAQAEPEAKRAIPQTTRRRYNPQTRKRELIPDAARQDAAEEKRQRKAAKRLAKVQPPPV